jgi:hypothetical protein
MGACASSKYADKDNVDATAKPESRTATLLKRIKLGGGAKKEKLANGNGKHLDASATEEAGKQTSEPPKAEKEEIEFIDHEHAAAAAANKDDEDQKREVTTYQTTVVKHTQKEGDELFTHLKEEAFRTLQNALRPQAGQTTTSTTSASLADGSSSTSTEAAGEGDDLLKQIQEQCASSIGRARQHQIFAIVQSGAQLIRDEKVSTASELQAELDKLYPNGEDEASKGNSELVDKVIKATTGFLTAKGTEAGVILSNLLANAPAGIHGVLNETEKTTVKVTRTVTEHVMTNGQLQEITKVITSNEPLAPGQSLQDIMKNLQAGASTVTSGTASSAAHTQVNEQHETVVPTSQELADKAEQVVNQVVTTAVERVLDEDNKAAAAATAAPHTNGHATESEQQNGHADTNGFHETTENVKVEEESTVTVSTTKIVLNGGEPATVVTNGELNGHLEEVQADFYKNGKLDAEEAVKKIVTASSDELEQQLQPVAQES